MAHSFIEKAYVHVLLCLLAMNSSTIFRNSLWLGLEYIVDSVCSIGTSIAIARVLGPSEMGYFVYVAWLAKISISLGNVGIPASAVKYMAQYWAAGEKETAKSVFMATGRIQIVLACLIAGLGIVLSFMFGDVAYRVPTCLLFLSIVPAMVNTMPTIANIAIEKPGANVPGTISWTLVYTVGVVLSLVFGWRLTGIAATLLAGRTVECVVRTLPVCRWLGEVQSVKLPQELRRRMMAFSAQSLVLMVLGVVIWDRSEVVFLRYFSADIRQIAFYSVAFGLADSTLGIVRIVSNSIGTTMRAQYGRNPESLRRMLPEAAVYLALVACPLYIGLAAISGPIVLLGYGDSYAAAIPVLMVSALLALPKAFQAPVQTFFQSTDKQGFMVWWGLCCGLINVGLDWLLIPRYAALGAAYGNGLAQLIAVVGLWMGATSVFQLRLPYARVGRFLLCAAVMGGVVWQVTHRLPPLPAAMTGVPLGVLMFLWMLRLVRALNDQDRFRLQQLRSWIPRTSHASFDKAVALMVTDTRAVGTEVAPN
jgi:O-antigen/teichoic acid export membrane protein